MLFHRFRGSCRPSRIWLASTTAAIVATLSLIAGPVSASTLNSSSPSGPPGSTPAAASAQPKGIFVADTPTTTTSTNAKFYPIPEKDRGSLIVMPDIAATLHLAPGRVPDADVPKVAAEIAAVQQSSSKGAGRKPGGTVTPMSDPNITNFAFGPGLGWYQFQRNTSFASCCGKTYSWMVDQNIGSQACTQGLGYYTGYNGGSFGLWSAWYSLGCGSSNDVAVPWDNVLAYPQLLARSMYGAYGGGTFE